MKLLIFVRHGLIDHPPGPGDPTLLLEGSWPEDTHRGPQESLDDAIDGRFDWIDRQAADGAERLAGTDLRSKAERSLLEDISSAYLGALALRYYLVKLIRLVAYFAEVRPLRGGDQVELIAAAGRDEDYAEVLSQHCRAAGARYRVRWVKKKRRRLDGFPTNGPWRRWAARLSRCLRPAPDRSRTRPRVVLCGDPRVLDPVCRELLTRRCNLWWLYDRFAVKSWLRWQATGIEQLVCNSSLGRTNRLSTPLPERWECRGVNLAVPVGRWLAKREATHGPRQTRLVEQLDAHFRRVRPHALVLDEDATPMARAAVAVGRKYGVRSLVVQHGVPCCRFGFAPPVADRILVWGRSSAQRLIDWDVQPQQIRITGSPVGYVQRINGKIPRRVARTLPGAIPPPRILLLTTVVPRDDRPDAVALHLTRRTYAEMLHLAFAAVAQMPGSELIVKLHPRSPDDSLLRAQQEDFPSLRCKVVRRGPLGHWLRGVDCVLSCGSTAGVEAAWAGVPVIQLAPPRASDVLPHDQWGLVGTVSPGNKSPGNHGRNAQELQRLLTRVLVEGWQPAPAPDPNVLASSHESAAARIADEVLGPAVKCEGKIGDGRQRKPLEAA